MDSKTYQQLRPFVLKSEWSKISESCKGEQFRGEYSFDEVNAANKVYQENIAKHIIQLERILGTSDHRQGITPTVDVVNSFKDNDPVPAKPSFGSTLMNLVRNIIPEKIPFINLDTQDDEPNHTYHDYQNNKTHLAIKQSTYGIEIASSLVHEGRHADQSDKKQMTSDEYKMATISRALYQGPEAHGLNYRNNYVEMQARIAEARLHIELFKHLQKDPAWNIQEREAYMKECGDVYRELTASVSEKNIRSLVRQMAYTLKHTSEECSLFDKAFDGETAKARNQAAAHFIETTGKTMHLALYAEWDAVAKELQEICQQLERETGIDRDKTEQADEFRDFLNACQDSGIPIINERDLSSAPDQMQTIDVTPMGLSHALQTMSSHYNPVIIVKEVGDSVVYQIGFDIAPRKREYYPEDAKEQAAESPNHEDIPEATAEQSNEFTNPLDIDEFDASIDL